jgi:hypothetical protein
MLIVQGMLTTMVFISTQTGNPSLESEMMRNFVLWLLISICRYRLVLPQWPRAG